MSLTDEVEVVILEKLENTVLTLGKIACFMSCGKAYENLVSRLERLIFRLLRLLQDRVTIQLGPGHSFITL